MKLKISNQCVCFYPIKIWIKKKKDIWIEWKKKKKKELIQHNVTYKKFKIYKKREKENVVDSYKEFWYIYIYIYICHQRRNYQINGDIYYFLE